MKDILRILENRKSTRSFSSRPVSRAMVDRVIEMSMRAPTAGNMMLYSILEVTDQSVKDKLAVSCDNQPFIATAPLVLLYAADYQRTYDYFIHSHVDRYCKKNGGELTPPGLGDLMLAVNDALIAAQTAVIAGEVLGLGSCYIGDIMENYEYHRNLFSLPDYVFPAALLCMGYPADFYADKPPTNRFKPQYIHFKDTYRRLSSREYDDMYAFHSTHYRTEKGFAYNAENYGQYLFAKKYASEYAAEMNRSVKAAVKAWGAATKKGTEGRSNG